MKGRNLRKKRLDQLAWVTGRKNGNLGSNDGRYLAYVLLNFFLVTLSVSGCRRQYYAAVDKVTPFNSILPLNSGPWAAI